jgi:hypothetical protein
MGKKNWKRWKNLAWPLLPLCPPASLPSCLAALLPRCLAVSLPRCLAAFIPPSLPPSLPLRLYHLSFLLFLSPRISRTLAPPATPSRHSPLLASQALLATDSARRDSSLHLLHPLRGALPSELPASPAGSRLGLRPPTNPRWLQAPAAGGPGDTDSSAAGEALRQPPRGGP